MNYTLDDVFYSLPLENYYFNEQNELQSFFSATSTFIINRNRVLLIRHTKENKVAGENYLGIGGKIEWQHFTGEKTTSIPTRATKSVHAISEDVKDVAIREIQEETNGFVMDKEKIFSGGLSRVKFLNDTKNTLWEIAFFGYVADDNELSNIKAGQTEEGIIEWVHIEALDSYPMQPTDRVVLKSVVKEYYESIRQNRKPSYIELKVEGIYDSVNDIHTMRSRIIEENLVTGNLSATGLLIPNFYNPYEYFGKTIDMSDKFSTYFEIAYTEAKNIKELLPYGGSKKEFASKFKLDTGENPIINEFTFPEHSELTPLTEQQLKSIYKV